MKSITYTLGVLAAAATLGFGQDQPPKGPRGPGGPDGPGKGKRPPLEAVFKKLDSDSSGSISLDEFKAGPRAQKDPAKAEEIFKKIDADSDGSVTLEEFKSHRPPHGPGKGKRKGGGGDPAPAPAE